MHAVLTSFIGDLEQARTVDELEQLFLKFIGDLGLSVFTYVSLRTGGVAEGEAARPVISNYPEEWRRHYDGQHYEMVDPVLDRAATSVVPVMWSDLIYDPTVKGDQKIIFHEAREFGLTQGMTIPIHSRNSFAIVSLASDQPDSEFRQAIPHLKHLVHLGALYYHERVSALREEAVRDVLNPLSRREREALLWAARGKTAWETGEILSISENTVKQYLKSAMEKLGVSSKPQAVVKAIMTYQIFP